MRNELAQEYNLPDVANAEVRLFFLENSVFNAWGVSIRDLDTAKAVYQKGSMPRQAYARAYSLYIKD